MRILSVSRRRLPDVRLEYPAAGHCHFLRCHNNYAVKNNLWH